MNTQNSGNSTYSRKYFTAYLLLVLISAGFVLMGFEMLGSRYLNPYFGGGITTWACLISVVLFAMMVGYFSGGVVADLDIGLTPLIFVFGFSGVSLLIVSYASDAIMNLILSQIGDGFWGALIAACVIVFIPVALISSCSPYIVKLMLTELKFSGRITGLVYSISTAGNIAGTLVTTFWLIPEFGTRKITIYFALILLLICCSFVIVSIRSSRRMAALVLAVLGINMISPSSEAVADINTVKIESLYPEGPLWIDNTLYFAEMTADHVSKYENGTKSVFWKHSGCGPTAITTYGYEQLAVNCHLGAYVAILGKNGKLLSIVSESTKGVHFRNPNDINSDGTGGVFFSDPGPFSVLAGPTGIVYRMDKTGDAKPLLTGMKYPNGVALDSKNRKLFVSEHLKQRVLAFDLDQNLAVVGKNIVLDAADILNDTQPGLSYVGPDGLRFDDKGNLYVAIYGAGTVVIISPHGDIHKVRVPMKYVTSIAINDEFIAVTGAYRVDQRPYRGLVLISDRKNFQVSDQVGF